MSAAVFRSGGKQFKVSEGDTVKVEKLPGQPGASVVFDDVLLIAGDPPKIGRPLVRGARVSGEIVAQDRASKLIVFKFKRRKKYRRKAGHRQAFTEVKITSITS